MTDSHYFTVEDIHIRDLTPDDGDAVQALLERCADYAELYTGLPVGDADAVSLYMNLPDEKSIEDKILLGIFDDDLDQPIGVLDAVRDYPQMSVWTIGLLLLEPDRRDQGIGMRFYQAFEAWAALHGAHTIQLNVVEQSPRAVHFWTRLGFTIIDKQTSHRLDYKVNVLYRMEHTNFQ